MDYKILFTESALADLDAIMTRAVVDHASTSEHFATALLNHTELLSQFPYLGVPVRDMPGSRRLLHSPFHIYYFINEPLKRIDIDHFWHFRRHPPGFGIVKR